MTTLFPDVSLTVLNELFLLILLNLVPLLIWAVWQLDQQRRAWLSHRRGKDAAR